METLKTHFEIPSDTSGNFKAKCLHCLTFISGSFRVTSNFTTHMKKKHSDLLFHKEHRDLLFHKEKTEDKDLQQKTLSSFVKSRKYRKDDPAQHQITNALVCFIAGDLVPLSVVESQYFKNLLHTLDSKYQPPSRKHLSSKLIHEKASEVRSNTTHQLQMAESICLTIDLWSNRQMKSYLGITGHFILDWSLKSVMVGCKRFKGRHKAENVRHEYEETIASFDIAKNLSNIITDNASNMVKAFSCSLPGYVDNISKDSDAAYNDRDDLDDYSEIDCEDTEDDADFEYLPTHSGCYAHTLQLVVKDGCGPHLKQLINKASSIVGHVRKSYHASEILEDEKRLQAANVTRWNSQLTMIQSILNIEESKLNQIECHTKLSSYERKLLQELSCILEPFKRATMEVQKEKRVSASVTIPVTLGLKHHLKKLSYTYNSKLVSTLRSSVDKRLSKYQDMEAYIFGAVLDPRFKLRWCHSPEPITEDMKKKLAEVEESKEEASPPVKKLKTDDQNDFFSFLSTSTPKRTRHVSGAVSEIDRYLSEECVGTDKDPLEFWNANSFRFSCLAKQAKIYLAVPATSAPVERLFSVAGKIFRPDRCRISDKNFEALMMIKCNQDN